MSDAALPRDASPAGRGSARRLLSRIRREPLALLGAMVVLAHLVLALVSPWIVPHDPLLSLAAPLEPPGGDHALGTDLLGRDVLSRVLTGGRIAIAACLAGILVATAIGTAVGLFVAYVGGAVDDLTMRTADAVLAIPEFLLISMLVLGFGAGQGTLVLVLAFVYAPGIARTVRARTASVAALDYVRAAELRGEGLRAILVRELLPNVMPVVSVEFAIRFSAALLRLSALSFLGIGVRPPTPDWGRMVQEAVGVLATDPHLLLVPALCLSSLVVALNFAVDGLARVLGVVRP